MTHEELIYSTLSKIVPGTKMAWPIGKAPDLPWFVYIRDKGGEVFADDTNYSLLPRYRVELYLRENDAELLDKFERAVSTLGPYSRRDYWIESQSCLQYVFHVSIIPNN